MDAELYHWRDAGRRIPIWWRDDDAIAATAPLDRLIGLSERHGLPLHLAVIPADARTDLAERLADAPLVVPVVHGWAHLAHTPADQKKAEFSASRPLADRLTDAAKGLERLHDLLGAKAVAPMFVPPWNRMGADMAPGLARLGYRFLSTYGPRASEFSAPGLVTVNTHVDVIDWRGTRSLVPPETLIARLVSTLKDRREGRADADEPLGLLTHHLVHDPAIWKFTDRLIDRLLQGPVQTWTASAPQHKGNTP
ncbi:MAG: polysaccharide deacetylase family protein [Pseudomonadota bacterium]|nr:polysaccharide deacetylase family protein [Pseudomonadota bacterium]